jgi:peptidase M50-like protein
MLGRAAGLLVFYACLYGGIWLFRIHGPQHISVWTIVALVFWLTAAYIVGLVAHELGHAIAVRLAGERVLEVKLGGRLGRVTFTVGTIPVSIGFGLGGSVSFRGHRLSARRRAAVWAAGPAANILAAPVCLLLPLPQPADAVILLGFLGAALQDLVPQTDESDGELSDGGNLWRIPARLRADKEVRALLANPDWQQQPGAADALINGFRLDVPEAEDCLQALSKQPDALLQIYRQAWTLRDKPEPDELHIVDVLTSKVLIAGNLPGEVADLAASRAEWVLDHLDKERPDERLPGCAAKETLALARLRQGRPADVRQLCREALAADRDPDDRATGLALMAMARHAMLLSGRTQLDEALALDPKAALVVEAVRVLGRDTDLVAVQSS